MLYTDLLPGTHVRIGGVAFVCTGAFDVDEAPFAGTHLIDVVSETVEVAVWEASGIVAQWSGTKTGSGLWTPTRYTIRDIQRVG